MPPPRRVAVWSLDMDDLRRLTLCAVLVAVQQPRGREEFARWWEADPPRLPHRDGE